MTNIDHYVSSILNGTPLSSTNSPKELVNSIDSPSQIVKNVIMRHVLSGFTFAEAVSQTMDNLERLAGKSEWMACILMVHLWPLASENLLHEVCDSIDLWVVQCQSIELKQHIQLFVNAKMEVGVQRHFEQLLKLPFAS